MVIELRTMVVTSFSSICCLVKLTSEITSSNILLNKTDSVVNITTILPSKALFWSHITSYSNLNRLQPLRLPTSRDVFSNPPSLILFRKSVFLFLLLTRWALLQISQTTKLECIPEGGESRILQGRLRYRLADVSGTSGTSGTIYFRSRHTTIEIRDSGQHWRKYTK
jgi:hypothetical protein